ncbi:antitoxin [Profundibacter sp.]
MLAVRLPKEFRFEGKQVRIRREGNAVVLEPLFTDWAWLDAIERPVDARLSGRHIGSVSRTSGSP